MPNLQTRKIKKQISIYLPIEEWRALRAAAVAQKIPITRLAMKLMEEGVAKVSEEFGSKPSTTALSASKRRCK